MYWYECFTLYFGEPIADATVVSSKNANVYRVQIISISLRVSPLDSNKTVNSKWLTAMSAAQQKPLKVET